MNNYCRFYLTTPVLSSDQEMLNMHVMAYSVFLSDFLNNHVKIYLCYFNTDYKYCASF